jgi:hypothetical protein
MAIYRCAIVKQGIGAALGGHVWRNIYDIEAADYDTALAGVDVIRAQEMIIHTDEVYFTHVTAHLVTEPPRRTGAQLSVNQYGLRSASGLGDLLPLWNVVRVDYLDVGIGRPERKYYRLPLHESDTTGLVLESSLYDDISTAASIIANLTNYIGPSGETHQGADVKPLVNMRQVGWHRRRRPGFVRGYVAV